MSEKIFRAQYVFISLIINISLWYPFPCANGLNNTMYRLLPCHTHSNQSLLAMGLLLDLGNMTFQFYYSIQSPCIHSFPIMDAPEHLMWMLNYSVTHNTLISISLLNLIQVHLVQVTHKKKIFMKVICKIYSFSNLPSCLHSCVHILILIF